MTDRLVLRPARATDAATIRRLVYRARLNPFDLDWRRFLVFCTADQPVAAAQLRPLREGRRELASVVVEPAWRGLGLGRRLVQAWQQRAVTPLFLHCMAARVAFYQHCGFRPADAADLPTRERRILRLLAALQRVIPAGQQPAILCWYPPSAGNPRDSTAAE